MEMSRAEELLERIAVGVEKLNDDPQVEIPTSPPICPNCGEFDPKVFVDDASGSGDMSQMFFSCTCTLCHAEFFVVPQGFFNVQDREQLAEILKERAVDGTDSRKTD
jgi:hypothetical protein